MTISTRQMIVTYRPASPTRGECWNVTRRTRYQDGSTAWETRTCYVTRACVVDAIGRFTPSGHIHLRVRK